MCIHPDSDKGVLYLVHSLIARIIFTVALLHNVTSPNLIIA